MAWDLHLFHNKIILVARTLITVTMNFQKSVGFTNKCPLSEPNVDYCQPTKLVNPLQPDVWTKILTKKKKIYFPSFFLCRYLLNGVF